MPPTAKPARQSAQAERDEFVRRFRVHHLLQSFSMVHFGLDESRWLGDSTRGVFVSSNNGDHHAVAWNPDGIRRPKTAVESLRLHLAS